MKHLDLRYFWIRDKVADGVIRLEYSPTAEMLADMLTKPLEHLKHERAVKDLGLVRLSSREDV